MTSISWNAFRLPKSCVNYVRLYTGDDHQTHFEFCKDDLSTLIPKSISHHSFDGTFYQDFHVAPSRILVILLDGEIEIETGNGDMHRFRKGAMLLCENLTGHGHRTRAVDRQPHRTLVIHL